MNLSKFKKTKKSNRKLLFEILFFLFFLCANFYCYKIEQIRAQSVNLDYLNNSQIIPWGIKENGYPLFWSQGYTGKNVKIAVMDTGINPEHPDLKGNLQIGFNAINPDEPPIDDNGHGTMVIGIISAVHNNIGVTGIAPDAEVYPIKVLDKFGEGNVSDVIRGVDWCIENGIQVINMSFALKENDVELRNSIQRALDAGIIIISSAANTAGGEPGYPASYEGVISVTSVDKKGKIETTSPKGKIDFSAPGVDIISTKVNGGYGIVSGTSFAAPHITGVVALLLDKNRDMTNVDVKLKLKLLSQSLGDPSIYGEGIVILK